MDKILKYIAYHNQLVYNSEVQISSVYSLSNFGTCQIFPG